MKHLTLPQYIEIKGVRPVANALKVSRQTVYNWASFQTLPPPRHIAELVRQSGGVLTFSSIVKPYCEYWEL